MNHKHLRELAERATGGEWGYEYKKLPNSDMYSGQVFDDKGENIAELCWHPVRTANGGVTTDREDNGKYIAAANPKTVIALLDEIERLRTVAKEYVQFPASSEKQKKVKQKLLLILGD